VQCGGDALPHARGLARGSASTCCARESVDLGHRAIQPVEDTDAAEPSRDADLANLVRGTNRPELYGPRHGAVRCVTNCLSRERGRSPTLLAHASTSLFARMPSGARSMQHQLPRLSSPHGVIAGGNGVSERARTARSPGVPRAHRAEYSAAYRHFSTSPSRYTRHGRHTAPNRAGNAERPASDLRVRRGTALALRRWQTSRRTTEWTS
jgi:hypothetical protein